MSSASDVRGPVELLADEFMVRLKRGEKPTIGEYCAKHPELAEEIRDVFEALLMVEDLKPGPDEASGSYGDSVRVDGKRLERIADYRILREIGRGGMGIVYEAEQEALGRRVALKVLPKALAGDGKALIRFQREAKAAARMHHTNIVPVFDVGQDAEHVFYAMQLIHGQGLDRVIDDLKRLRDQSTNAARSVNVAENCAAQKSIAASLLHGQFEQENLATPEQSRLPETAAYEGSPPSSAVLPGQSELSGVESNRPGYYRSVAQIGLQTASALAYAHARGIIHRDIKPGNLLLDAAGNVWVTDFGLAKTGDGGVTHTGDILGTIRYMAPERFRGHCDVRADVYALGLTLYELLTLKPAYASPDRLHLIEQIRQADPPTPRSLDLRLPLDLDTIIVKAIDKDPKRRYQSADELAEDLQRFVADEPIKARRIGTAERFARWCRRNPALASSLAATLLILVVGLSLVTWKWNAERKARADADTAREEVEKKAAELAADIERMNTANALMQSGREFHRIGDLAKADQFFTEAVKARKDHSGTWLARGQLYTSLGLWELAREDYARAAALTPLGLNQNGSCYAFLCLRAGDRDELARRRDAMLESPELADPDQFYALNALRTCNLTADKPDAIRKILARVEALPDPRRSGPFIDYFKGISYYRLGQYDRALECLQRSLDPSREWEARDLNYPILAMVHFRSGQLDEARNALDHAKLAAERWDNEIFTASRRFVPLPTVIDWPEFLWYYDEASKLITGAGMPVEPRRLVVHARALAAVGKVDAAAKEFRRIAELAPRDPQIRFTCFTFNVEQQRLGEAAAELAAVTAVQPKDPQVRIKAFRVYADYGAWKEAKAQHQRAIELAPADRKIALEHFRYHADRGEWPQADAAYAEQLARLPNDADLRIQCALLHAEAKRWEQVYAEYAKIISLRPDDAFGAWNPYALVCLKTGRLDEYRKTCAELLKRAEKTKEPNAVRSFCVVCLCAPNPRTMTAKLVAYTREHLGATHAVTGGSLYRNGEYAEAVKVLTKVLQGEQDTGFFWSRYSLAMAYHQLGKYDLADRWLMEANQMVADEKALAMRAPGWVGRLSLEMMRDEAEQLILGKRRHRPVIADLIAKADWQAALERFDALAKDDELNSRDWTNRGRCYTGLQQWAKALTAYDKAIALGADDYNVWFLKGQAHNRSGEYQKSLTAYERAEQNDNRPGLSTLFHERTAAFNGLRQYDKALAAANRAIELGDNSAWLRRHRSEALRGLDRFDDAIRDLSIFQKAHPADGQVLRVRGECYARKGKWDQAQADFREALRLEPEHSEFHYQLVIAELAANNLDRYRAECKEMAKHFGNTTSAAHAHSIGYVAVVLPDSGIEMDDLVRLARQAVPLFAGNERLLGAALVRAGQYQAAIEQFDKSAERFPGRGWDWLFLAMAHHHLGHDADAKDCLAKAVKWIEEADKKKTYADTGSTWIEWFERVEVQHLRAEAESLVSDK